MSNGHAHVLNPLAAAAIAQNQRPQPPQRPQQLLLMTDIQCLSIMAAIKGGDPGDAVDWSVSALARTVIAVKSDAIGKEVQRLQMELANASSHESQRVATSETD